MKKEIKISGMHCAHCASRVEKALKSTPGIGCSVSLGNGSAVVECEDATKISDAELREAVETLGFDVISVKEI